MHCRDFRDQYSAFIDGALSDAESVAMQVHLAECETCARRDIAMRRGMLVLRNLPAIEPSADFLDRLNHRLSQVKRADARAAAYRGPGVGSFMALAAGVLAAGFAAAAILNVATPTPQLTLAPIVTMRPAAPPPPSPAINSGFVASAAAGLPVWPAAMMAEQAPVRFASVEQPFEGWGR